MGGSTWAILSRFNILSRLINARRSRCAGGSLFSTVDARYSLDAAVRILINYLYSVLSVPPSSSLPSTRRHRRHARDV